MRLYVRLLSHMFRAHGFVRFHMAVPKYLCCVFLKQRTCVTAAAMVLFHVMSTGQIHAHMSSVCKTDILPRMQQLSFMLLIIIT